MKFLTMLKNLFNRTLPTPAQQRELEIAEALAGVGVGETVTMPWGERVTLLDGGVTAHSLPLTPEQAATVRVMLQSAADAAEER